MRIELKEISHLCRTQPRGNFGGAMIDYIIVVSVFTVTILGATASLTTSSESHYQKNRGTFDQAQAGPLVANTGTPQEGGEELDPLPEEAEPAPEPPPAEGGGGGRR